MPRLILPTVVALAALSRLAQAQSAPGSIELPQVNVHTQAPASATGGYATTPQYKTNTAPVGRVAGAVAGGGGKISTAFDRVELISDALTAILASHAKFTVVTEDSDFDVLSQFLPGLPVVFYDRALS